MVREHHQLNGHEFEQTPADSEGQRRLACCSSCGHRVGHNLATEQPTTTFHTGLRSMDFRSGLHTFQNNYLNYYHLVLMSSLQLELKVAVLSIQKVL